jgi:LAGLIDADG endonuclease
MNRNDNKLNNWIITGLIDAEGSFGVNICEDSTRTLGYNIYISLEMGLNYKDKPLLDNIQKSLGVGYVYYNSHDKTYKWKVSNINEISDIIIPHFRKYYLLTQKRADFELFAKIVEIMLCKEHLTVKGLQDIVNLKSSLNLGLNDTLKKSFPDTKAIPRPLVSFDGIPDPNWLLGFAEGEGCFFFSIYESSKSKLGLAVQLVFKLTQHSRDVELLKGIADFLKCGRVENRREEACDFTVNSVKSFENIIIPFFLKYPLQGSKLKNFEYFNKVFDIMKVKGHLTSEGLIKIKEIKAGMNTNR